jgi:hypothetical protein
MIKAESKFISINFNKIKSRMTTLSNEHLSGSASSPSFLPKYQFYLNSNPNENRKQGLSKPLGNAHFEANHSRLNKIKVRDIDFTFTPKGNQPRRK